MAAIAHDEPYQVEQCVTGQRMSSWDRDLIGRALNDSPFSLMTPDDIDWNIASKKYRLWHVYDCGNPVGAFVTEIVYGGKGRAVNVVALGGDGMPNWIDAVSAALVDYAKMNQCRYVAEIGRTGWRRVLAKLGWVRGPIMMIKAV
jgi:hypothetical protein